MPLPDLQEPLALLERKEIDAAIEVLEQKVSGVPAHLPALVLLARAYEAQRRWDHALDSWTRAEVLMPNSPVVESGKQRVLRRMNGAEDNSDSSVLIPALKSAEPFATDPDPTAEASGDETDETHETNELAQLRRRAEQEARTGGARPDLSGEGAPDDSSPTGESPPTPEEQIEKLESEGSADDLERLIDDLESARIEPDPEGEDPPPPDLESDAEDVVSETLAQIHESQGDYQEAARIYGELASQHPDRADEFKRKAEEMREQTSEDEEE